MKHDNLIHNSKLFAGTALSFFLLFLLWHTSYGDFCFSLFFPLLMLLAISYGYIELKMAERHCIKKCYFKEKSLFSRLLSSRILVTLVYMVLSLAMTVSTFVVSLDFPSWLWGYLLFHILVSVLVFRYLDHLFIHTFQEKYQSLFAREWSIRIMAVLLIGIFVYMGLNTYTPEYLTHSLKETVMRASDMVSSHCVYIEKALKIGKMIDSSFWWVINESTAQMDHTVVKSTIWLAFLFYNSLALLGINRLIMQIIYLLDRGFSGRKKSAA